MDTHTTAVTTDALGRRGGPRRRWPEAAKRKIVEETFEPGASVAIVARRYELNANVVFAWRRLYRAEEPGAVSPARTPGLIPVNVIAPEPGVSKVRGRPRSHALQNESIEILLAGGARLRFSGNLAREALKQIIAAVCAR